MFNLKPHQINLGLSLLLVGIGLWSFEASGRDNHTMSVPILGILLSLFHKQMKLENAKVIKIVMGFTALIFIILLLPLRNSFLANHTMAILRVGILLIGSGLALVYYYNYTRFANVEK